MTADDSTPETGHERIELDELDDKALAHELHRRRDAVRDAADRLERVLLAEGASLSVEEVEGLWETADAVEAVCVELSGRIEASGLPEGCTDSG